MADDSRFGGYRIGTNIPFKQGAVWDNVARASRWGAGTIELNTSAEMLGRNALEVIREQAKVNNLRYTWHIPPSAEQAGELAVPNDKRANAFARDVLKQAIVAAENVGARHITFHATTQAGRLDPDKMYVYDVREDAVKPVKKIPNLSNEENVRVLNEHAKMQFETQLNNLESQYKLVNSMAQLALNIRESGVDTEKAGMLNYMVKEASKYGSIVGVQPEDPGVWMRIQDKVLNNRELNSDEKRIVSDYSEKVLRNVDYYKRYFKSQIEQVEPWVKKSRGGEDLVKDGQGVMIQNVANNIAMLPQDVLKQAVSKGISLGFENLPGNIMFSTPGELIELRRRTVDKLVEERKLSREEAEKLIGFTFDFAHANITKNMNIGGEEFRSVAEFIGKIGPENIRHIHAVDGVGVIDAHLPLGQGEVGKEWDAIKKALEKFKGTSIFELPGGSEAPITYVVSSEFLEPGLYSTPTGIPTHRVWGPSYVEAAMTDPLMLQKDSGYFYESFVDVF